MFTNKTTGFHVVLYFNLLSLFSTWPICLSKAKTRIRKCDWLKLVSEKIHQEQLEVFLLFSVFGNYNLYYIRALICTILETPPHQKGKGGNSLFTIAHFC